MKIQSRRAFIVTTALSGAGLAAFAHVPPATTMGKDHIMHHVLFWLKNKTSEDDLNKLIEGLRSLKKIKAVRSMHIGIPAATELRPVVDNTYSASALFVFDDLKGQNAYQVHDLHQAFIRECAPLWERILVYDAMEV